MLVLSCPLLRLECMERAVAAVNVDAGNAHVAFAVGVVHDRAGAAEFDGFGTAGGWWCVGGHGVLVFDGVPQTSLVFEVDRGGDEEFGDGRYGVWLDGDEVLVLA